MQQSRNEALKVSCILARFCFFTRLAIALFARTNAMPRDACACYMGQCCVSSWQRSAFHHAVNDMLMSHKQTFESACDARQHLTYQHVLHVF